MTEYNENQPNVEQDTDFETEAEAQVDEQPQVEQTNSLSMTSGMAAPPSPTLDTEDGGSDWDPDHFTPPTLEEMPTEGPGSPGYDVYAPENAKWEDPALVAEAQNPDEVVADGEVDEATANAPLPDELPDEDATDVQVALERETADGPGFENESELPQPDAQSSVEDDEDSA